MAPKWVFETYVVVFCLLFVHKNMWFLGNYSLFGFWKFFRPKKKQSRVFEFEQLKTTTSQSLSECFVWSTTPNSSASWSSFVKPCKTHPFWSWLSWICFRSLTIKTKIKKYQKTPILLKPKVFFKNIHKYAKPHFQRHL